MAYSTPKPPTPFFWWHLPLYPVWVVWWIAFRPPLALWRFFRGMPPSHRVLFLLVSMVCFGLLGYFGWQFWQQRRETFQLGLNWRLFDDAARRVDTPEMTRLLNQLQEIAPTEPRVVSRRKSFTDGEGDPRDTLMTTYWMNRRLAEGNLEKAAREARKRLDSDLKAWQPRCILAEWELSCNRPRAAVDHLMALPAPARAEPPVVPAMHNHAIQLLKRVELFLNPAEKNDWWEPMHRSMRDYRYNRLLPVLKGAIVEKFSPLDRIQLLECYLASFEDLGEYPKLPSFWVPASRVAQTVFEDPVATIGELTRLGDVQFGLLGTLDRLIQTGEVGAEAKELTADLEERLEAIWKKVRDKDPKSVSAAIGLSRVLVHRDQLTAAAKLLADARDEIGHSTELLAEQFVVLQRTSPEAALEVVGKAVNGSAKVEEWFLYFQAALRAGRPDKAMEACREARKLEPRLTWVALYDAELSLAADRHADALEALAPVRPTAARTPEVARLYVRAYLMAGADARLQELLKEIDFTAWTPSAAASVLRELIAPERMDYLLIQVDKLVQRGGEVPEVLALQADLYRQAAEPRFGTGWDRTRLDTALAALRRLRAKEPDNLQVVNVLAFLQLKGQGMTDLAMRTADPLRRANEAGKLPASMQLTLGAIYLETGKADEARRVLEVAAPKANTAAGWIDLGRACHRLNRTDEARTYLRKASSLPRLPRETAELNQALQLVEGK